ncbi:formimidoylglutamase [Bacillus massilinigeriensis]|uniref:formimidoylglutamase n=1 Tax=Bacillus mediterraneensis TaxID=1805474 RepID=UPI0008F89143|nr:formimidoylglutamase [Bacillus mediterraneensis]
MYIKPVKDIWSGRTDSETDIRSFRYHQQVKMMEIQEDGEGETASALLGFSCDEGVRRNEGRQGAAKAPLAVKQALAKLPWHLPESGIVYDAGNIACEGINMEEAQEELGKAVSSLLKKNITPIIIGGGHETFYGHYQGAREYIGEDAKLGIINIDAHFDMRPYDAQTSSGTMFRQILDQDKLANYLCLGIQQSGNTAALFDAAEHYGVKYLMEDQVSDGNLQSLFIEIDSFVQKCDALILTLCMDSIDSSYAPGVSAPTPFGLHPKIVRKLVAYITSINKTLSFDLCEVNPELDEGGKTVSVAANMLHTAMMGFHKMRGV